MKFGWPRVERDAARVAELRSDASAADESGSLQNGSIGRAQHPANLALLTLGASETALTFLVDLVPLADRRCERSAEVTGDDDSDRETYACLGWLCDLQSAFLRCHLKHRANAVSAAREGRAVEIPRRVKDHAAPGKGPIRAPAKGVENCLRPGWRHLKHYAGRTPSAAAIDSGAVEIPLVHDQAGIGIDPIYVIVIEAVENPLRTRERHLKHRAIAVSAAIGGGAVEIPRYTTRPATG